MLGNVSIRVKDVLKAGRAESSDDARDLICEFKNANSVTLDFSGIDRIGDEFARELFVTWRKENRVTVLNVLNACESVESDVERALKTK